MRRTRYYLALASLVSLTAACEKEKLEDCPGHCTVITGQLLTSGRQGLTDAQVSAYWRGGSGYFGSSQQTKARATTDVNGNYKLSFYAKDEELQDGYFRVDFEPDKARYLVLGEESDAFFTIRRDTTYQQQPYLIPRKAIINLTVPNANQIQGTMWIEFSSAHGRSASGSGTVVSVTNQASYSIAVTEAADQPLAVQVTKTKNGTATRTTQTLTAPAGTTQNLTITY